MKSTVSAHFMFLDAAKKKKFWEVVCDTYSMKKNASRVFEAYEDLFSLTQGVKSLQNYYSHFKSMIVELNKYNPVTNEIEVLKSSMKNYMFVSFFQVSVLNSNHFDDSH